MTGVKIFTCTRHHEKEQEGDKITEWLRDNPDIQILEKMVLQSSDISHHCLTVAIFYHDPQANQ
ncbi:MAG: hypothetical protein HQ530_03900 [Parcubacteria group bacterium]|nr:hypothetical protein [Parcubacteria group bacterium]